MNVIIEPVKKKLGSENSDVQARLS
jgi:hypothetical protein